MLVVDIVHNHRSAYSAEVRGRESAIRAIGARDSGGIRAGRVSGHHGVAVRGHKGWSRDPDATARYALVVTVDVVGEEVAIYEPVRVAVEKLQTEAEVDVEIEEEVV